MEDKTLNTVSVTENLQNEKESNGLFVVLSVLKRFWVLILIFTIIGAGIGIGLALANDKTVYTQTKKVVCIAKIENKTMLTNISLTNRYIPTIKDQITTSLFIDKANEIYGKDYDPISASAIGVTAGTNLILRISYSDVDPNVAEAKLNQQVELIKAETSAQKVVIDSKAQATKRAQEGYTYQQERGFDVARDLAKNDAKGQFTNLGIGLGTMAGVGVGMSHIVNDALNNANSNNISQNNATICKKCGSAIPANSKFCLNCGEKISYKFNCPQCGKELIDGAKFCPECGAKII